MRWVSYDRYENLDGEGDLPEIDGNDLTVPDGGRVYLEYMPGRWLEVWTSEWSGVTFRHPPAEPTE